MVGSAIVLCVIVNAVGLATTLPHLSPTGAGDWLHLASVDVSNPYATPAYRWAPAAIVIWNAIIEPMGFVAWGALHVAAVFLLRSPILIAVTLVSWPFWSDLVNGNALTFVLVATACAMRGGTTLPFFFLALLMPRPLMLPALLWILWKRPDRRTEFLLAFAIVVYASMPLLAEWFARLWSSAPSEIQQQFNIGPSRVIGLNWMFIGLPVGAWLLARGRVGLAGLAWSPYWLSYYLMMPIADLPPYRNTEASMGGTWPPSTGGTARP